MKKLFMTILGAAALAFGGCSWDTEERYPMDGDGDLLLSVRVPSLVSGTATRAQAGVAFEKGENTINSLHLLFFAPSADGSGQYVDFVEVQMPENDPETPEDNVFEMNIDTPVDLSGTSLSAAAAYNILALANVSEDFYVDGTADAWMSPWTGKTESQVIAESRAALPTALSSTSLLMHGRMEKPAGEDQIHLLLERDVVRFDVVNEEWMDYDLISVSIWNGYTATSIWETGVMDYSSAQYHTRRHYGVDNKSNTLGPYRLGDIKGGLYAFENQVAVPGSHDNLTTCLIVGMRSKTRGTESYFRVNMTSAAGAQVLRRNHVYTLTIKHVYSDGASDEETAYLGRTNNLVYDIDGWNVADNGLIVRDEYSVLSIPTKTVTIGRGAQDVELSIHTFSTLPSPAPLTVRSQTYRPVSDDIQATLDGNTLKISASALGLDEEKRNGVIVLSYAGLEISLDVAQSGVHDDYLYLTLPDGGIPRFPAYAGISSGLITVQATGPWTAELFMSGFSFNPSTALAPVQTITSEDNLVVDDPENRTIKKFRVYTHSFNTTNGVREAIIRVTLDKAPETYKAVVLLSQEYVKKLYVRLPGDAPSVQRETASATFNGAGTGLATGITLNSDKFFVISGTESGGNILPWDPVLTMNGLTDDSQHFQIVDTHKHISEPDENYVTVKAKGLNTSGREYRATLRVQTDPGTFADITLVQQPANWDVPHVSDAIAAVGGETDTLKLDAYPGMHYIVEIESVSGTGHFAYVAETTGGTKYSKLKPRSAGEPFVVGFPKMIYPNLYNPISATVKVTIVESGQSKTFAVVQMPPVQKRVDIFNTGTISWGGISYIGNKPNFTYNPTVTPGSDADGGDEAVANGSWYGWYCGAWARNLHTPSYYGNGNGARVKINTLVPGMASATPAYFNAVWDNVKSDVTFVHFNRPGQDLTELPAQNEVLWNWINGAGEYAGNEGVMLMSPESDNVAEAQRESGNGTITGKMGLSFTFGNQTFDLTSEVDNRVMEYLTVTGPFSDQQTPAQWVQLGQTSYMSLSSVQAIDQAVPVLVNAAGNCGLMIDPKRRIVVKTDSEMVQNQVEMNGVVNNVQAWMINTAQYGTHFSEYFWNSPRVLTPQPQPQE